MKKKILITGASGFVGQHLSVSLAEDYSLFALSRDESLVGFDATYTWDALLDMDCTFDVVIHLAGLAHDTSNKSLEEDYFNVNMGLTEKLVNWINKASKPVKIVYFSSIKVFGDLDRISDEYNKNPTSVYGRSKLAAEKCIESTLQNYHNYYLLRPVMIYGEGNKGNLPKLYDLLIKGVPYFFGSWENKRSILSVQNLDFVVKQLIKKDVASDGFIVSDDETISTYQMLKYLFSAKNLIFIDWKVPSLIIGVSIRITNVLGIDVLHKLLGNLEVDNSKLKKALNIKIMPLTTEQGLTIMGKNL